jgi:hypothetical protein
MEILNQNSPYKAEVRLPLRVRQKGNFHGFLPVLGGKQNKWHIDNVKEKVLSYVHCNLQWQEENLNEERWKERTFFKPRADGGVHCARAVHCYLQDPD